MTAEPDPGPSLVLYDDACGLCQASVRFIARRAPQGRFRFAPLQPPVTEAMLRASGAMAGAARQGADAAAGDRPRTLVLVEGGRLYTRSTAALRIARRLRFPWNALAIGLLVPRRLRDAVYDLVARHRRR